MQSLAPWMHGVRVAAKLRPEVRATHAALLKSSFNSVAAVRKSVRYWGSTRRGADRPCDRTQDVSSAYAPPGVGRTNHATRARPATHSSSDGRQNQLGQHCVGDAPLLRTRHVIVAGVHGHDEVEGGHQEQALAAPTGAGDQALSTYRTANGDISQKPLPAVAEGVFYGDYRRHRLPQPGLRHDLPTLPGAAGEHHLANAQ